MPIPDLGDVANRLRRLLVLRDESFEFRSRDVLPSGLAVLEALDVLGRGLCHACHVSFGIGRAVGLHFSVKSRVAA